MEFPSLLEENRRIHKLLSEGVDVEYLAPDGTLIAGKVILIDFTHPEQNEHSEEGKKKAHRGYQDAGLSLSKAFSLASDEAKTIREEVGFFQAIRAALVKSASNTALSQAG